VVPSGTWANRRAIYVQVTEGSEIEWVLGVRWEKRISVEDEKAKKLRKKSKPKIQRRYWNTLCKSIVHLHSKLSNTLQNMYATRTYSRCKAWTSKNAKKTNGWPIVRSLSRVEPSLSSLSMYLANFIRHLDPSKRYINHRNTDYWRDKLVSWIRIGR